MAGAGEHDPPDSSSGSDRPDDSGAADAELKARIVRDEIRLARDEQRIAQEERWIRRNWWLELALGAILALTVAALVISVMALDRDIDRVAASAPRDDSVDTPALQDGAVSGPKLADGAITTTKLADEAVTGRKVARGALTSVQIDEAKLGDVPRAARAGTADRAGDASALAGVAAGRYLSRLTVARAQTRTSTLAVKGPLSAACPDGATVLAGGASVDGAARVAITTSAPDGSDAWVAKAAAIGTPSSPWRLVVTAVCASGG
jgi:hypothetical protein